MGIPPAAGISVTLQAGNCIDLLQGFEVQINTEFLGEIQDCPALLLTPDK